MSITESVSAVESDSTSLHTVSVGEGVPIIVVSGGPGLGHYYLRPGMDILADRFRLIYYDQRGSGSSELGDPDKASFSAAIDDLDAVRQGFGIERANLLGHSFGANLALLYASRHPQHVASLVLANPGPPFRRDQQEMLGAAMRGRIGAQDGEKLQRLRLTEQFQRGDPETVEDFIRTLYIPFFRDPASASKISFDFTELSAESALGEEAWMHELAQLDEQSIAGSVRAPTLVLYAELDPIPEEFARSLADSIPGARYEFLKGANHMAYYEDPEIFAKAVVPFLEGHAL